MTLGVIFRLVGRRRRRQLTPDVVMLDVAALASAIGSRVRIRLLSASLVLGGIWRSLQ